MASATNENQGLKVTVAVLMVLVLLLSIGCYLGYSSYSDAVKQLEEQRSAATAANTAKTQITNDFNTLRDYSGYRGAEFDAVGKIKDAKDKNSTAIKAKLDEVVAKSSEAIAALQKNNTGSPVESKEIENLKSLAETGGKQFVPAGDLNSQVQQLAELNANFGELLVQIANDNIRLRRTLASVNTVHQSDMKVVVTQRDAKAEEYDGKLKEFAATSENLRNENTALDKENSDKTTELSKLQQEKEALDRTFVDTRKDLTDDNRRLKARLELKDTILDVPDGYIQYVDNTAHEVRIDLTRSMGVRPQMTMTVFDKNSPGIPTDQPKGTIELIRVGDTESIARIKSVKSISNPINIGDIVYSSAWNRNEPELFALIGKMDINRDGKDDRADVKRLITAAGGKVVYDLPPPSTGSESGVLSPRIDWLVVDDQFPIGEKTKTINAIKTKEDLEFEAVKTQKIEQARLNGVRNIPLRRIVTYLGYGPKAIDRGRVEFSDNRQINKILYPNGRPTETPKAADAPAEPASGNDPAAKPDPADAPAPAAKP